MLFWVIFKDMNEQLLRSHWLEDLLRDCWHEWSVISASMEQDRYLLTEKQSQRSFVSGQRARLSHVEGSLSEHLLPAPHTSLFTPNQVMEMSPISVLEIHFSTGQKTNQPSLSICRIHQNYVVLSMRLISGTLNKLRVYSRTNVDFIHPKLGNYFTVAAFTPEWNRHKAQSTYY